VYHAPSGRGILIDCFLIGSGTQVVGRVSFGFGGYAVDFSISGFLQKSLRVELANLQLTSYTYMLL